MLMMSYCDQSLSVVRRPKMYRDVSWVTLYQNCSNNSATLNKMATRAINRNKLLTTSSAKSVDRF